MSMLSGAKHRNSWLQIIKVCDANIIKGLTDRNKMLNENRLENKQLVAALMQMCESELIRLLNRVETLAEDFQGIPLRDGESVEEVAVARKMLKIWSAEVNHLLKVK